MDMSGLDEEDEPWSEHWLSSWPTGSTKFYPWQERVVVRATGYMRRLLVSKAWGDEGPEQLPPGMGGDVVEDQQDDWDY